MVSVPQNTFLASLLPAGTPIPSDPYQYTGAGISYQAGNCPAPFGSDTDTAFCQVWCVNSCPELNPSPTNQTNITVANQLQTTLNLVNEAITAANQTLSSQTASIVVTGTVAFPVPSGADGTIAQAVMQMVQTQLPLSVTDYHIEFTTVRAKAAVKKGGEERRREGGRQGAFGRVREGSKRHSAGSASI